MKICYIDLETGGVPNNETPLNKVPILQISFIIEIDNKEIGQYNYFLKPFEEDAQITKESLEKTKFNLEEIFDPNSKFKNPKLVFNDIFCLFKSIVNIYDKKDKMIFCGYNSHSFDMPLMREFFIKNGEKYFGSFFWYPSLDMMLSWAASIFLKNNRTKLDNFELETLCNFLNIEVDKNKLHDGLYDVYLVRELLRFRNKIFSSINTKDKNV